MLCRTWYASKVAPRSQGKQYSLGIAEEESSLLTECLKEGDCVQEIQALMHSSGEAVKVLTKRVCTDNTLADQVAVVHTHLDTALLVCAVLERKGVLAPDCGSGSLTQARMQIWGV